MADAEPIIEADATALHNNERTTGQPNFEDMPPAYQEQLRIRARAAYPNGVG